MPKVKTTKSAEDIRFDAAVRKAEQAARCREYKEKNKERLAEKRKADYAANPERFRANARRYAARHPDKCKARRVDWVRRNAEAIAAKAKVRYTEKREELLHKAALRYAKNRDTRVAYTREWRAKNPERARATVKKRQAENKANARAYSRAYYVAHKEERRVYAAKYTRTKMATDETYRVRAKLRKSMLKALTRNFKKNKSTSKLLGCTLEFARKHLESQFKPGMAWSNHGQGPTKWVIDHRTPLSTAKTVKECERICHYTNLQPLWYYENLHKSDRLDWPEAPTTNK